MKEIAIKEIIKNYPIDYFDENMKNVIYYSALLISEISQAEFEYDTYKSDNTLLNLKNYINKIEI